MLRTDAARDRDVGVVAVKHDRPIRKKLAGSRPRFKVHAPPEGQQMNKKRRSRRFPLDFLLPIGAIRGCPDQKTQPHCQNVRTVPRSPVLLLNCSTFSARGGPSQPAKIVVPSSRWPTPAHHQPVRLSTRPPSRSTIKRPNPIARPPEYAHEPFPSACQNPCTIAHSRPSDQKTQPHCRPAKLCVRHSPPWFGPTAYGLRSIASVQAANTRARSCWKPHMTPHDQVTHDSRQPDYQVTAAPYSRATTPSPPSDQKTQPHRQPAKLCARSRPLRQR
jgi:hypothetical protein